MSSDPFSMLYTAMFNAVADSERVKKLVNSGNIVRLDGRSRSPLKEVTADADLPELVLVPTTAEVNLHSTSSSSRVVRQYQWLLSTGDLRLTYRLEPVAFALLCAMSDWRTTIGTLTWNNASFVKRVDMLSATIGMSDSEKNRGIRGWSCVWDGEVEMHFKTTDLQAYNVIGS